jgi:PmbA protein
MDSLFDQSALVSLAERLISAARAAGADAADAVAMRSVSQSVDVRDGAVEESQRSESNDVGLRVMIGNKQAVVSTNDLSGDGVKALAERAAAMARVAPEDRYAGLADASLLAKSFPDLDLVDRDLPDTAALERMARRAEDAGRAVKGVSKSGGASASAGIGGMVLLTSHGFSGAYLGSRHSVSMQAIAGEGTGMETDYDFCSTLHAADLDEPEKIGRTAGEKAVAKLNPRKVSTRKVPVVFDWSIAGSVIGHLVSAINGSAIARKTSFLKDKMGERIFAPGINIIDDPLRKRGLRSRPFDGEGVAGRRMALVEDGVLKTWILDSATARELGRTTTGHAGRSASSTPSPSPTNLHLEPGQLSPEQLIRRSTRAFTSPI